MASEKWFRTSALASLSVFVTAAAPAVAADQIGSVGIEDIVVTARRTEENIQTTPVAVTALSTEMIKQAQVGDVAGLQRTAPSLSIATGAPGGSGFVYISIRGMPALNPGVANDPSVATYVDGVYIPRPSQGSADLIDLQRVEVLRGPQGTLFGRNTTGGALNIVTVNPTGDFEGQFRIQGGNYDYRNIDAVLNVPLVGDELAARFVYDFVDHDGYARNVTSNSELKDRNSHYARAKLRWAPAGSNWSATLSGDYNIIKDHGQFVGLAAVNPGASAAIGAINAATPLAAYLHNKAYWYNAYGIPFSTNPPVGSNYGFLTAGSRSAYNRLEAYGGNLTIDGEIGSVTVKSISAYRYSNAIGLNELDGTPAQILAAESAYKSDQYSQELQLSGELGDRFSYILGSYYSTESGRESSVAQTFGSFTPAAPAPNFGFSLNYGKVKNISVGLFGQGYYRLTDTIRLTGGVRWTWDKREVVLLNRTNLAANSCAPELLSNPDFIAPCSLPRSVKYDYPAWTAGIDVEITDGLFAYVKTSAASKAGGFNMRNGSAATPPFKPEKVRDVELGVKFSTSDNRLRINAAAFHSWQSEVQRNASDCITPPGALACTTTQFLRNSGNARVYGGELEISAVPWGGMLVSGNLALLDGKYVAGTFVEQQQFVPVAGANVSDCVAGTAAGSVRCSVVRSGEALPQMPKKQFGISVTQKLATSVGELSIHVNYAYIGRQNFGLFTADPRRPQAYRDAVAIANRINTISGYGLFNGRIALQIEDPNLELSVFGRNIGGKKYVTRAFADQLPTLGTAIDYIGDPFTWGIGATFRFGPKS
ncbi:MULTISPECIES: TonB-dependent receptor [Sphingobium]|jgi:iron complex outermembrane recepter protein|uniref:TonB-dependent receptor n=1 Tax=Sphingobium soli TaxID=1591116 RepID=A0ABS8H3W7_9SPHN|nr:MULTISPECIES: TonB-dependent receptor [Sphingobium]MCC4233220.1 TonB-dependent receptor [Sphingobium soli]